MEVVTPSRITVPELARLRQQNQKIVAVTAYDFPTAAALDEAGVDLILVGDSLGTVVQGLDTTIPVTLDEIIYHCKMVMRATRRALVAADLPFMTYQASVREAVKNAGRVVKEAGAQAVKPEGGRKIAPTVRAIVETGIPVIGHIGLLPQSVHAMGGYRVQGKKGKEANSLVDDALALQEAGASAVVLEGIPTEVASRITAAVDIPTIGIGAGAECSGQILVFHDLVGFHPSGTHRPKFVKQYVDMGEVVRGAVREYAKEVRSGAFPSNAHTYSATVKQVAVVSQPANRKPDKQED